MKHGELYIVKWTDASVGLGWEPAGDTECDDDICYSIGILTEFNDERITLSMTYTGEPESAEFQNHSTIPRKMIVSMKEITALKIRKRKGYGEVKTKQWKNPCE